MMHTFGDIVVFNHNDKWFALTQEQIDAAYAYRQEQNLADDVEMQLNRFVFGYDDPAFDDSANAEGAEKVLLEFFERSHGFTYEQAKEMMDLFVKRYTEKFDCNQSENDCWACVIATVLAEQRKEREMLLESLNAHENP